MIDYLFVSASINQVNIMLPVAELLKNRGRRVAFLSLDPYCKQGDGEILNNQEFAWSLLSQGSPEIAWYLLNNKDKYKSAWNASKAIDNKLKQLSPECVIIGNDLGYIERQCILIARRYGAKTVLLQDGLYRTDPYENGWRTESLIQGDGGCDLVCTWGENLTERLEQRGVCAKIAVTGNPKYDLFRMDTENRKKNDRIKVLFAGQCHARYERCSVSTEIEIHEKVIKYLIQRDDADVVFKLHPHQNSDDYNHFNTLFGPNVKILKEGDTLSLIDEADLVISIDSTVSVEAVVKNTPVIMLGFLLKYLAYHTEPHPDFRDTKIIFNDEKEFEKACMSCDFPENVTLNNAERKSFIKSCIGYLDGKSSLRITEELESLVFSNDEYNMADNDKLTCILVPASDGIVDRQLIDSLLEQKDVQVDIAVFDLFNKIQLTGNHINNQRIKLYNMPCGSFLDIVRVVSSNVKSEYIARVSTKGMFLPGWAKTVCAAMKNSDKNSVVSTCSIATDLLGNFTEIHCFPDKISIEEFASYYPGSVYAFKRKLMDSLNIEEEIKITDDSSLVSYLAGANGNVKIINAALYAASVGEDIIKKNICSAKIRKSFIKQNELANSFMPETDSLRMNFSGES